MRTLYVDCVAFSFHQGVGTRVHSEGVEDKGVVTKDRRDFC